MNPNQTEGPSLSTDGQGQVIKGLIGHRSQAEEDRRGDVSPREPR